jgi:hypothetical protein
MAAMKNTSPLFLRVYSTPLAFTNPYKAEKKFDPNHMIEVEDEFCSQIIKAMISSQGFRRGMAASKAYGRRVFSKSAIVFEIARRWIENLRNDPLMSHSIRDEIERWMTKEGITSDQITKSDRSRIRDYVISAEIFLEAKLRKHGVRFEAVGNRFRQVRRLTEPFSVPDTTAILSEVEANESAPDY